MNIIMKFYIENYLPVHLNICKITHLHKKTEILKQIYSVDGIFRIEGKQVFKLYPVDKEIQTWQNYYKHYTILCDDSSFNKEEVYSQIPFEHVLVETTLKYYCLGNEERKVASLYLVIHENKENGDIQDFYFLSSEQLENRLVQEELDVFLKLLF